MVTTQQRPRIERQWVKDLPEIVQGLLWLLDDHGREFHSDQQWAHDRCKAIETAGLYVCSEGDEESGPYRIEIRARSVDDGLAPLTEPLLSLEIRPGRLWMNEARAAIADPGILEKWELPAAE